MCIHMYTDMYVYTYNFFSKDSIFYPNSYNYHITDQMRIKDSKETNWLLLYNRIKVYGPLYGKEVNFLF